MRKTQTRGRRLAIRRIIVRTLCATDLSAVAAGWESSAKTSGNILCAQLTNGDPEDVDRPTEPQA